jgi:hypothetical protein
LSPNPEKRDAPPDAAFFLPMPDRKKRRARKMSLENADENDNALPGILQNPAG